MRAGSVHANEKLQANGALGLRRGRLVKARESVHQLHCLVGVAFLLADQGAPRREGGRVLDDDARPVRRAGFRGGRVWWFPLFID